MKKPSNRDIIASFTAYGYTSDKDHRVIFAKGGKKYVVWVENYPELSHSSPNYNIAKEAFMNAYYMTEKDYGSSDIDWNDEEEV